MPHSDFAKKLVLGLSVSMVLALPVKADDNLADLFNFTPFTQFSGKGVVAVMQDPHELYMGTRMVGAAEQGIRGNEDFLWQFGGELELKHALNVWDCHPDSDYYCRNGFFAISFWRSAIQAFLPMH